MKLLKNLYVRAGLVAGGAFLAAPVFAGGPDLTALTGAVDYTTVIAAILAIATLICGLYLAIAGSKTVMRMVKSS